MAVLSTLSLTMADHIKRTDPNGEIASVVEILNQTNEFLDHATFMEGNLPNGHQTTIRTGLPSVYYRMLNQGILPSKSETNQVTENTSMLEAYSELDKDLAARGGMDKIQQLRLSEARPFLEAMMQRQATTFFYGAASAPAEFVGLAPRYSDLSAGNAQNIIDAGGTGSDNASIWLVCWGENEITGLYPQGSQLGIYHEDLGLETVENAGGVSGALMRAYRDHWQWKAGLCVKDWRYAVRICNIDISNLVTDTTPADLIEAMEHAQELIPTSAGRQVFYMNRTLIRFLRKQYRTAVTSGGGITYENVAGRRVRMFGETMVSKVDALVNTESQVT